MLVKDGENFVEVFNNDKSSKKYLITSSLIEKESDKLLDIARKYLRNMATV